MIGKKSNPEDKGDLRNLSLTLFMSKLIEKGPVNMELGLHNVQCTYVISKETMLWILLILGYVGRNLCSFQKHLFFLVKKIFF